MAVATLTIIEPGHESWQTEIGDGVIAIGRALDNQICLESDANVSRYHAEIERRGDDFWIADLGSSNGTTVNDEVIEFERQLIDGDLVTIGGSTVVEFHLGRAAKRVAPEPVAEASLPSPSTQVSSVEIPTPASDVANIGAASAPISPTAPVSGLSPVLIGGAIVGGLLITVVVAALLIGRSSGSCDASARIVSPQNGTTIRGAVPVRVEVEGAKCIDRLSYQLDGVEIAKAETAPYDIILDPTQISGIGGGNHVLSVTIEDEDGEKQLQQETVLVAFSTNATTDATPAPSSGTGDNQNSLITTPAGPVDVRTLADRLAGQISRKSGYTFDRDFVDLIRIRTNEYRISGFSERARPFRRQINKAFRDQGVDPLLGYLLAMSRSKFDENARGTGIGLWQLPFSLVQEGGYVNQGETEAAMKDPKRSAEIAAAYTKALLSTFESTDDFMYVVACFGMPLNQAGQIRTELASRGTDANSRRDFFRMVKSGVLKGEQADRVVRFFAAGIVSENPQSFGLTGDEPFSSLF
ncbi:MAG TPA: FHA domain-containing protein [Pyrinomonadaceae bacterium]